MVDAQEELKLFNVELNSFNDRLCKYKLDVKLANSNTIDHLEKMVENIGNFFDVVNYVSANEAVEADYLKYFTYKLNLLCNICQNQLSISNKAYLKHKCYLKGKKKSAKPSINQKIQNAKDAIEMMLKKQDDEKDDLNEIPNVSSNLFDDYLSNASNSTEQSTNQNLERDATIRSNQNLERDATIRSTVSPATFFNNNSQPPKHPNADNDEPISQTLENSVQPTVPATKLFTNSSQSLQHFKFEFSIPSPHSVPGFQDNPIGVKSQSNSHSDISQHSRSTISSERLWASNWSTYTLSKRAKQYLQNYPSIVNDVAAKTTLLDSPPTLFNEIVVDLTNKLRDKLPKISVSYYGSMLMGLNTEDSHLDINLSVGYGTDGRQKMLKDWLAPLLLKDNTKWTNIKCIKKRTLHLMADYKNVQMCDISMNNELSVCNAKLVNYFFRLQPNCRRLAVFVKIWIRHINLDSVFDDLVVAFLSIFYFQIKYLLPPISQLVPNLKANQPFIDWHTTFSEPPPETIKIQLTSQYTKHVFGFLKLFGFFDYGKHAVCPIMGQLFNRQALMPESRTMPDSQKNLKLFAEYMNYNLTGHSVFNKYAAIIVQDPFELAHNLTECISEQHLLKFKNVCKEACLIMQDSY